MKSKSFVLIQYAGDTQKWFMLFVLLFVPVTTYADYFIDGEGKEQPFCEKILVTLNKTKPTKEKRPCVPEVVRHMPGVSEPQWEPLDFSQYESLLREMLTVTEAGQYQYFDPDPDKSKYNAPYYHYPTSQEIQRKLEYTKKLGAKLFALRLPNYYGFGDDPKRQTNTLLVLRHMYREDKINEINTCGLPPYQPLRFETGGIWVTPDLKKIQEVPLALSHGISDPFIYRGRIYSMMWYGVDDDPLEISIVTPSSISKLCNIKFSDRISSKGDRK